MKYRLLTLLGFVAVFLSPAVATAQQTDQVVPLKGSPIRGVIKKTTPSQITVVVRSNERILAVNEVQWISFASEPQELSRARNSIRQGRIGDALTSLKKINLANVPRDEIKRDIQYYLAYCLSKLSMSGGGDKTVAGRAMAAFIQQNPNSHHFYEANEVFGDMAVSVKSYATAAKHYAVVGQAPWAEYKLRAGVLEARALLSQKKVKEALAKFDEVAASNLTSPAGMRQKQFAAIGKARCLAETGKHAEGIQLIQAFVAKNDPQDMELFGKAYNALGVCYLKSNKPKEALLAYLHVDILFYSTPDAHSEALFHLVKLWTDAGQSNRAQQARNLLRGSYSGSVWAAMENQPN